jgi:hypothetical protein
MPCRSRFQLRTVAQRTIHRMVAACFTVFLGASALCAADEETYWTVLTVARNGNWGIATALTRSEAIAGALLRCQTMTDDESDCGAELVAFRSGLALALMCGEHRIIVTADDAGQADSSALERMLALRDLYGPDFPACRHLLQIDCHGALTTFRAKRIDSGYSSTLPK